MNKLERMQLGWHGRNKNAHKSTNKKNTRDGNEKEKKKRHTEKILATTCKEIVKRERENVKEMR